MPQKTSLDDLAEVVKTHLLPLLQDGLLACAERHLSAEGQGADNRSFCCDAWNLPARLFIDSIEDGSIPFKRRPGAGCTLLYGPYRLTHHRVGFSADDDIRTSFPNGAKSASKLASTQLELDFGDASEIPEPDIIVLAYMANPAEGLCAAHLATVSRVENNKIVAWQETLTLYEKGTTSLPPSTLTTDHAPAETAPPPLVRLNKAKDQKSS